MADRPPFAHAVFFPAAALYAALILPWSVLAMGGQLPAPPGLLSPGGHAHEMLFGYALAVVAGYLLGPLPRRRAIILFSLWLGARLSFLLAPGMVVTFVLNGLFALLVALGILPRFMKAAKKWRNKTVAPVVGGLAFCATTGAWLLAVAPEPGRLILREAVLLLSLLLFFMGGRIIAPAIAGYRVRRGETMKARVQPGIEGSVLVLIGLALLLQPWQPALTATLLIGAGVLAGTRWLRWRPWLCLRRADLLALLVGYLWLGIGLLLTGLAMLSERIPEVAAIHAITVGALGTLSLVVMMRTRLLYRFRDANHLAGAHLAAVLIQGAALCRVLPPLFGGTDLWLVVSAGFWALAFLLGLVVLLRTRDKPRPSSRQGRAGSKIGQ